jgi:hypothetical protein
MKANPKLIFAIAALFFVAGCSSQPSGASKPASQPAVQPTETLTGREAFQKLYIKARGWAPDIMPVRLESTATRDDDGHNGKAAVWRCTFASPSRQSIKPYTWSGSSTLKDIERGVTPGIEDTWNPANASEKTFELSYLEVDSDTAWNVALQNGGEKLLKSAPHQLTQYALAWDPLRNSLQWHVIYGQTGDPAQLRVAVNASDGQFLRVEK